MYTCHTLICVMIPKTGLYVSKILTSVIPQEITYKRVSFDTFLQKTLTLVILPYFDMFHTVQNLLYTYHIPTRVVLFKIDFYACHSVNNWVYPCLIRPVSYSRQSIIYMSCFGTCHTENHTKVIVPESSFSCVVLYIIHLYKCHISTRVIV